jgi:phosphoribosyl 1,2-cyclic phosphate phosphodiesterase
MRQSAALIVEPGEGAQSHDGARSSAVMIDFPSEIASQSARHGVDLSALQHLLITHSHGDHWFPYLLRWRARPPEISAAGEVAPVRFGAPRFTELPLLHIWGNSAVESVLRRELGDSLAALEIEFHKVGAGSDFVCGDIRASALPANHDVGRESALHYVLSDSSHSIFYGLDGDTFLPETRDALRGYKLDVVILESTYGHGDGRNHRNFARVLGEAEWLRQEVVLKPDGRIIATHFSPHHCPMHEETAAFLAPHGIEAAWDGMTVQL